ncbi:hypothetical protein AAHE18_06G048800 [Arachis hypogaea]
MLVLALLSLCLKWEVLFITFPRNIVSIKALQTLKKALGLPPRFGWNGDPCVPQQHPWIEADCQLNKSSSKWLIDGLGIDNQSLKGFLPDDISKLHNL